MTWPLLRFPMSERQSSRPFDRLAQKWSDLAERRRAHALDLYRSGRWKHYYNEGEFIRHLRDVNRDADEWARIAGSSQVVREAAE
jgi:hypothetical protein